MKITPILTVSIIGCTLFAPVSAHAQGTLVRTAVTELLELFTGSAAKQYAKQLTEIGGENTVRVVIKKAAEEGGDDLVRQVAVLGKNYGPRAIKALEVDPGVMSKAFRTLPKEKMADAVFEAARDPGLMTKLVRTHGNEVLTASARHPGIGTQVIDEFGSAGLKATKELGTDEVVILAKTKGFSELPAAAQRQFVGLLDRDPRVVTNFLRLAGGGTAIVLTAGLVNKVEGEIFGKDDKPGRLTKVMERYAWITGGVMVSALVAYAAIKLWGVWILTRAKSTTH